jgi:hypothetical protein
LQVVGPQNSKATVQQLDVRPNHNNPKPLPAMQASWWWILDSLQKKNILVVTALMQLPPFFEKHSPGIKFQSRAVPIIRRANIMLLIN